MALFCGYCNTYYSPSDPKKILGCDYPQAEEARHQRVIDQLDRAWDKQRRKSGPVYTDEKTGEVVVPDDQWTVVRLTPWQLETLQNLIRKGQPKGYAEKVMHSAITSLKVGDKT